jgi:adenylate cyclase
MTMQAMLEANMQSHPRLVYDVEAPAGCRLYRFEDHWREAEQRMVAILFADVVGYTELMGTEEADTFARYKAHRSELIDPKLAEFSSRFVKSTGDGFLVEFVSTLDAVSCALQIQQKMVERNQDVPVDRRIVFRMGLSYGRVIVDPEDIYGHEVNVAARLQTIAPPGGLAISAKALEMIQGANGLELDDLGTQQFRNMSHPVHVYTYRRPQSI